MEHISYERLIWLFDYDEDTGVFTWSKNIGRKIKIGDRAGFVQYETGHRIIRVDGKKYAAHRLAWLYITERWPEGRLIHLNGEGDDNRAANLRMGAIPNLRPIPRVMVNGKWYEVDDFTRKRDVEIASKALNDLVVQLREDGVID